jgi:hypothetical protein
MGITLRDLSNIDRERLMELHGYQTEYCITISINAATLPTPNQLELFMRSRSIPCSWVRAGVIMVCVRIGNTRPEVLSLEQIRRVLRQTWLNASLHRNT